MVNILPETLVIGSLWLDISLEIPLLCKLPICEASLSSHILPCVKLYSKMMAQVLVYRCVCF